MYDKDMNASHYTADGFDAHDVMEWTGIYTVDYDLGNVIKYIVRHRKKGRPVEDLKKARWYLNHAIKELEEEVIAENEV